MTSTFETYRDRLDSHRRALRAGLTDDEVVAVIRGLDAAVSSVDGVGFAPTPATPQPALAEALGIDAELWVKDETGNVSGSHKGRHLFGVALGLISCYKGFYCKPGAEGVGRACTSAFVASFIAILALDYVLAVILQGISERLWGFRSLL